MIVILTLVLHLIHFSQPTSALGTPVCSTHHNEVNPRTIYSVINSLPRILYSPIPGQLHDSTNFHLLMPGGGPWYFPAVFQTSDGDAQVSVSITETTLAMNMHDQEEIASRVWAHARNLALELFSECQMATTGRGGHSKAAVHEQGAHLDDYHTVVEVRVGTKLGMTGDGRYHKPVSVYEIRRGGGPPVLLRPSRLIDQRGPEHYHG